MSTSDIEITKHPKGSGFTLAIIGCGTMGTSILTGILNTKSIQSQTTKSGDPKINSFIATVNSPASFNRLTEQFQSLKSSRVDVLVSGNLEAMQRADIILLACKPYMIEGILGEDGVSDAIRGKLVISVLVGTPVEKILSILNDDRDPTSSTKKQGKFTIIRAMPNLAAGFGDSNTVLETDLSMPLTPQHDILVRYIFDSIGNVVQVGPAQYDAASVLAAASMAFLTVAIDGILDGGVKEGIKREEGRRILVGSLRGLVGLLEGKGRNEDNEEGKGNGEGKKLKGRTGDEIREEFSSPRGTTIEGLIGLEEDRVRYAYCRSVMRATKRSLEM